MSDDRTTPSHLVEAASKAFAEATDYYVPFHRGLSSPSADKIRKGILAAIPIIQRSCDAEVVSRLEANARFEKVDPTPLEVELMQNLFAWNEDGAPISLVDDWPGLLIYVRKHVAASLADAIEAGKHRP